MYIEKIKCVHVCLHIYIYMERILRFERCVVFAVRVKLLRVVFTPCIKKESCVNKFQNINMFYISHLEYFYDIYDT